MVKIALGAGHGINTPGKRCAKSLDPKETREWFLNDRIARYVEEGLKEYSGYEFRRFDDRTGKRDVPLSERVRNINAWKPDIFVSSHHDAGAKLTNAGGMTVYIAKVSSTKSKVYQKKIYDSIIKNGGLRGNRATPLPTANFYMVKIGRASCRERV